ncbi:Dihydroorotate dehydrogenase B (NAD(+)), catalytic subunit [subsurface metagenome]
MDLSIQSAPRHPKGLVLANPVMTASGTFGYGTEYSELIDIQRLGAVVCKGTTLLPREGNPQPRLVETSHGLLNSVGLENIGVDAVVKDKAPMWASWRVPVIVNIVGESISEYVEVATRLEGVAGISGVELNISCPNVAFGGLEYGANPRLAAEVTAAVKAVTSLPLIVKLSPNVTDVVEIALVVEGAGADAVCLINTVKGLAIDINEDRNYFRAISGGLSGPAIKPIALRMVYDVAKAVQIPVIGCGGISCASDALEFVVAGASAVQVGTVTLANPRAALEVLEGIEHFMVERGIPNLSELVGVGKS